jgi:hypothetical protein
LPSGALIFAGVGELFADVQLEKAIILPYSWSSKRVSVFQGEVVEYQQLTQKRRHFDVWFVGLLA